MPKKVLPDEASFAAFSRSLRKRGFRRIARKEFRNDFERLGLIAPSSREGREVGFQFHANGLVAVVWTTFLVKERVARDQDAGWVLIREGDQPKYFARPLRRTKNFLKNLLRWARIAQLRVMNRPLCTECHARMNIVTGRGFKSRYWQCERSLLHDRAVRESFDYGLPKEALEFLKPYRNRRRKNTALLKELGKKPGAAVRKRIGWKMSRPENRQ